MSAWIKSERQPDGSFLIAFRDKTYRCRDQMEMARKIEELRQQERDDENSRLEHKINEGL